MFTEPGYWRQDHRGKPGIALKMPYPKRENPFQGISSELMQELARRVVEGMKIDAAHQAQKFPPKKDKE